MARLRPATRRVAAQEYVLNVYELRLDLPFYYVPAARVIYTLAKCLCSWREWHSIRLFAK